MKTVAAVVVALAALAPTTAHAGFRVSDEMRPSKTRRVDDPSRTSFDKHDKAPVRAADPVLTHDMVLTKIKAKYMPGLQRCYERTLQVNSRVKGKVALVFTVDVKGRVLSDLEGLHPTLDQCLTQVIAGWRFPHSDEPTEASFKINISLHK